MAATAGLSLTLDPMGKMFQNASSLKPNHHWKVLYKVSVFLCRSKIQDGHQAGIDSLDPMGKCAFFSTNYKLIKAKLLNFIGWSSTKCVFFYADRKFKMAATAGHRLTLEPYGKMFKCLLLRNYKYD